MGQAPTLCVSPSPTSMYYYFLVDSQSYPQKTMRFLLINRAFGALGRLVSEPLMQWGRRLCWIHWMVWLVGWLVGGQNSLPLWNTSADGTQNLIHLYETSFALTSLFCGIYWIDPDKKSLVPLNLQTEKYFLKIPRLGHCGTQMALSGHRIHFKCGFFVNLPTEWSSDFISTVRTWNLKKNRKSPFALILYL